MAFSKSIRTQGLKARAALFLSCLLCVAAFAQLYTGSVTGVVTDPSSAVVPGAQLRLLDEEKGFSFSAVADSAGRYVIRQVPPGIYKLIVEAQGFRGETQSGIKIDVSQNVTVNFSLQLGSTSQSVEITASAPLLATEDAVTGQT